MFDDTYNWVKHTVRGGICITCKQRLPGQGDVYTRGTDRLEGIVPIKANDCKGVTNG